MERVIIIKNYNHKNMQLKGNPKPIVNDIDLEKSLDEDQNAY